MPSPEQRRRRSVGILTMSNKDPKGGASPLTLREAIGSVLAAMLGVQSNKNRERDFRHGSPRLYVMLGLGATILFVLTVYIAVKLILVIAAD
jgi:hypothetical protein